MSSLKHFTAITTLAIISSSFAPIQPSAAAFTLQQQTCTTETANVSSTITNAKKIVLSQSGFSSNEKKVAILRVKNASGRLDWQLRDNRNRVARSGKTIIKGFNETSGETVHEIRFNSFSRGGTYQIRVPSCNTNSRKFTITPNKYEPIAFHALKYFYHNRSGEAILATHVQNRQWARPAAFHQNNNATCFDERDNRGTNWPACNYTLDIKGGWFDAGDFGKYVVNGGLATWALQDVYERNPDLWADDAADIPESGNGESDVLDEARQELEFLISMQVPQGQRVPVLRNGRVQVIDGEGLAHHKTHGKNWPGFPMKPHDLNEEQFLYPPSTAATLNLAGAAAQGSRLWRGKDNAFANKALTAAVRAFNAATQHPDLFAEDRFNGGGAYQDSFVGDEFTWAAAELYATTKDDAYLPFINITPGPSSPSSAYISWDHFETVAAITVLRAGDVFPSNIQTDARNRLMTAADDLLKRRDAEEYSIPLDTGEYYWGSNSVVAFNGVVLSAAYDLTSDQKYLDGAVDAIDYLLGRNALDVSYVSGMGSRAMSKPHHRFWGKGADSSFPPPPPGALAGGSNKLNPAGPRGSVSDSCEEQRCWEDNANSYSMNEVAINWNASLFWLASFLHDQED